MCQSPDSTQEDYLPLVSDFLPLSWFYSPEKWSRMLTTPKSSSSKVCSPEGFRYILHLVRFSRVLVQPRITKNQISFGSAVKKTKEKILSMKINLSKSVLTMVVTGRFLAPYGGTCPRMTRPR